MPSLTRPSGPLERLGFERAQRRWFAERREVQVEAQRREPFPAIASNLRTLPADRPVHVVVVPQEGDDFGTHVAGTRNLYWEAAQTLRELLGNDAVSSYSVGKGDAPEIWHAGLLAHLHRTGATHLMTHIESDPGSNGETWTWDVPAAVLGDAWDGVFLGVLFDSAFPWITTKARLLARMSPNFVAVDICLPLDGELVRGRPEIGPVNMPMSDASMRLVEERLAGQSKVWDVSFIGAMYPYRVELVQRLRAEGLTVAVNPHRVDEAEDFAASRSEQPGWLEYMAGLHSSRMTINFSRSSAGPITQLKTRVLEATLARTVLLTDDVDRSSRFWNEGVDYVYFPSTEALPGIAKALLEQPALLDEMTAHAYAKATWLARHSFWGGIERGLRQRGLRPISETLLG